MYIDRLEPRRLMDGGLTAKVTHTGVLQVTGSPSADAIAIHIENRRVQIASLEYKTPRLDELGVPLGTKIKRVRVELSGGNDTLEIESDVPVFVDGSSGKDAIAIDARSSTVLGGSGNDSLISRRKLGIPAKPINIAGDEVVDLSTDYDLFISSANLIDGGLGNDVLKSQGGDDTIVGGAGDDRFIAGSDDVDIFTTATVSLGRAAVVNLITTSVCSVLNVEHHSSLDTSRRVRTVISPYETDPLFKLQPLGYQPLNIYRGEVRD